MDDVSRKAVCFVSLDVYPLLNPKAPGVQGGSEVDFYMLATELAKDRRFRVSVITGDFGQPDVEMADNITIYKAADIQKKPLSGVLALWKSLRLADADIYFKKGMPSQPTLSRCSAGCITKPFSCALAPIMNVTAHICEISRLEGGHICGR